MAVRPIDALWVALDPEASPPPAFGPDVRVRALAADEAPGPPAADVAVLVLGPSPPLRRAFSLRVRLDVPVLYVVPTADALVPVLGRLFECDDACMASDPPDLVVHRLRTLHQRWSSRTPSEVSPLKDVLTGLQTVRTLRRMIERHVPQASPRRPLSLLWIDLDRFRVVNDRTDLETGNLVLCLVANRLTVLARVAGLAAAARVDGDVFALLLPDGSRDRAADAAALAQAVIGNVMFRLGPREADVALTASIGAATTDRPCPGDELVRRAREALVAAKARGTGHVVHHAELDRGDGRSRADQARDVLEDIVQSLTVRLRHQLTQLGDTVIGPLGDAADRDALTGLSNRGFLDRRLERDFTSAQTPRPYVLAMLDVDHFGSVNRTYGWPTGDRALKDVAACLAAGVREGDLVARYGGEEIAVVMAGSSVRDAHRVLERLRRAVAEHEFRASDGRTFHLTVSVGACQRLDADASPASLLERVSDRLLAAKRNGRNQVVDDVTGPGPAADAGDAPPDGPEVPPAAP